MRKYMTITPSSYSPTLLDELFNEMAEKGYRLHTIVTIPSNLQLRCVFESLENKIEPDNVDGRRLEPLS